MSLKKSKSNPLADFFMKPKAKPSHKGRNTAIAIVVGSALITGLTKGKKAKP